MYKVEVRMLRDAPEITHDDVMGLSEAAKQLGIIIPSLDSILCRGDLTTVIDEGYRTARGKPRRLVLRSEIEQLKKQREEKAKQD